MSVIGPGLRTVAAMTSTPAEGQQRIPVAEMTHQRHHRRTGHGCEFADTDALDEGCPTRFRAYCETLGLPPVHSFGSWAPGHEAYDVVFEPLTRPASCADVNPARLTVDPLLAQIADLVSSMDLYVGRAQVRQLTTEQKELWADLVDAACVLEHLHEQSPDPRGPRRTARWWRDDYPGPTSPHDPRWQDVTRTEPDPFIYDPSDPSADAGDDTTSGAASQRRPDPQVTSPAPPAPAAVQLARLSTLDVLHDPHHPHRGWLHEDIAAVYSWAQAAVRPMRNTAGEITGDVVYPSMEQTRAFLERYRANRSARLAR